MPTAKRLGVKRKTGLGVGAEWTGGAEKCCLSAVQRSELIFQCQNGLSGVVPETSALIFSFRFLFFCIKTKEKENPSAWRKQSLSRVYIIYKVYPKIPSESKTKKCNP